MMPHEDDRVNRLEGFRENVQQPKPGRRVDPAAIFVRNDPCEDSSWFQDAPSLHRDASHLLVKSRITARNPSDTSRIVAIRDVVGVRRVNHRERSDPIRQGPGSRIRTKHITSTWDKVERNGAPTEGTSHIPDRARTGHRVDHELAGSGIPPDEIAGASGGRDAVERRITCPRMSVRLRRKIPACGCLEIRPTQHGPRPRGDGRTRMFGGEGHGRFMSGLGYQQGRERGMGESENLPRTV